MKSAPCSFASFILRPGHGDGDGLLFEDDRKPAAFGSARIGHRFPADGTNDLFQ